ncbi:MAG TPA: hypothetical protein VLG44_01760 [Chlamydiales bacterium]|nr:hypothetical protein [Chlamydiales bacterium]
MSAAKKISPNGASYNHGQVFSFGFAAGGAMFSISSYAARIILNHPDIKRALSRPVPIHAIPANMPKLAFCVAYLGTVGCTAKSIAKPSHSLANRQFTEGRWRSFN